MVPPEPAPAKKENSGIDIMKEKKKDKKDKKKHKKKHKKHKDSSSSSSSSESSSSSDYDDEYEPPNPLPGFNYKLDKLGNRVISSGQAAGGMTEIDRKRAKIQRRYERALARLGPSPVVDAGTKDGAFGQYMLG